MMSASGFVFRIIIALIFPPLSILGMRGTGCGTVLLLLLLTLLGFVPGQVVAIFLIVHEYLRQDCV